MPDLACHKTTQVLDLIWSKLKVKPAEEEVIVVEPPETSKEEHHRLEELMFNKYKVKYLALLLSPLCVCKATGISTGLWADCV